MLDGLAVCLVEPGISENIGMVARACANMGCPELMLVCPVDYHPAAAARTATEKGRMLLDKMFIHDSLPAFLEKFNKAWAVTARTGGWRRNPRNPESTAREIIADLESGMKVALVFGNEKRGLQNRDIALCGGIINIPTYGELTSLNLAQAVLIVLYECARVAASQNNLPRRPRKGAWICGKEMVLLESGLKDILVRLHCCQGKNPDYHFLQWHNLLERANLRRHEYDAIMGLIRQINNFIKQ